VGVFLHKQGLGSYSHAFVKNHISGKELLELTDRELHEEFALSLEHQKFVLRCINFLKMYFLKPTVVDHRILKILSNYIQSQSNIVAGDLDQEKLLKLPCHKVGSDSYLKPKHKALFEVKKGSLNGELIKLSGGKGQIKIPLKHGKRPLNVLGLNKRQSVQALQKIYEEDSFKKSSSILSFDEQAG